MKFYLFMYEDYKARGGVNDLCGVFDAFNDAYAYMCKSKEYSRAHIYDGVNVINYYFDQDKWLQ